MRAKQTVAVAVIFGAVLAGGCRISSDKHGDSDNVKIATPFGGMQVKTNDAVVLAGIGLPEYPGAVLVKKDKENGKHDDGAADVNFSFGSFQLRVKAASYRSTDGPDAVIAFYRKALGRYGDVIQCQDNKAVGSPTHTAEGLTCDNDKENHLSVSSDQHTVGKDATRKMELKAGSKLHQHIVSVEPDGNGTKFGLVVLDLPGHFSVGSGDEENKQ
jgi:hypothetical protein